MSIQASISKASNRVLRVSHCVERRRVTHDCGCASLVETGFPAEGHCYLAHRA